MNNNFSDAYQSLIETLEGCCLAFLILVLMLSLGSQLSPSSETVKELEQLEQLERQELTTEIKALNRLDLGNSTEGKSN